MPEQRGSVRLFKALGVEVFLHWTWLVGALIEVQLRRGRYESLAWNVAEYVTLFAIVLMHEYGHALACRSVGGKAETIVLWPLGGVAYVNPPPRPLAVLWSIAAGPLVNLVLAPIGLVLWLGTQGMVSPDVTHYFQAFFVINVVLFAFNMVPIYPLDGGQILRAILWLFTDRSKSLLIASWIGVVGSAGAMAAAVVTVSFWLGILAVFGGLRAWAGLRQARALAVLAQAPVYDDAWCPSCGHAPPMGMWPDSCGTVIHPDHLGRCPGCGASPLKPVCLHCGNASELSTWARAQPAPAQA